MIRDSVVFFFFNDTATTEIYTLSLHDALPISETFLDRLSSGLRVADLVETVVDPREADAFYRRLSRKRDIDRKSTRLNSSHANISYAVFCLKKKKMILQHQLFYPHHCKSIDSS